MIPTYLVKFDSYWITSNSAVDGTRYLATLSDSGQLSLATKAVHTVALDGSVIEELFDKGGIRFSLTFDLMDATMYAAMVSTINTKRTANTYIDLVLTGFQTFTLKVKCLDPDLAGEWLNAGQKGVKFNFITTV